MDIEFKDTGKDSTVVAFNIDSIQFIPYSHVDLGKDDEVELFIVAIKNGILYTVSEHFDSYTEMKEHIRLYRNFVGKLKIHGTFFGEDGVDDEKSTLEFINARRIKHINDRIDFLNILPDYGD